jgi:hypothetical protein
VSPRSGQQFAHDEIIAPEFDIAFADPGPYVYTQYTAATTSTTTTAIISHSTTASATGSSVEHAKRTSTAASSGSSSTASGGSGEHAKRASTAASSSADSCDSSSEALVGILLCTWLGDTGGAGASLSLEHAHCMPRGGFRALHHGSHVLTVQVQTVVTVLNR